MTVPLSDTQLAEFRNLRFLDGAITEFDRSSAAVAATRALVREVDRLRGLLAAEPAQPSPEHQAIYLDDFDQVWCDYPTVPASDDVLPLVWASERAQSRAELADGGNRLRVIGWCR